MEDDDAPVGRSRGAARLKTFFKVCAGLSFVTFIVLAILKGTVGKDASSGTWSKINWGVVTTPLLAALAFHFAWLVVNYFTQGIVAVSLGGGQGGQYYYNLLGQLLVKEVHVSAIENINEAIMLRHILRSVWYTLIVVYSFSLTRLKCSCSIPYTMIAFGFISTYLFRLFMLLYNGFYDYHRYHDMATEVRSYQESLVGLLLGVMRSI